MSLYWSNRVGIPTATDPEGKTGPGNWWLTGSCRPVLATPGWAEPRGPRRARRLRHWLRDRKLLQR
jgi:hypothetical protein